MKKIIIALLILFPFLAMAQESHHSNSGKMDAYKVSWLTTKLDLSAEEAKIFWPIYNDFIREQKALRAERGQKMISFKKITEIEELSDTDIQTLILNDFSFKQRDLNIERKYYNLFRSKLPLKIVGKFYRAQETFKKELLSRYKMTPAKQ